MLVKICGLTTVKDAMLAVNAGADFLGIVLAQSSARRASLENARAILQLDLRQRIYLVFGYDEADYIRETFTALADDKTGLQIMADHPQCEKLLKLAPVARILPSISAAQKVAEWELSRWQKHPLVLFDSHRSAHKNPTDAGNLAGGTGKTFDPANVSGIRRPYLYAGGLTHENVAAIIAKVNPAGVDVASGTELAPGIKDPEKLLAFVKTAKHAAQTLQTQQ